MLLADGISYAATPANTSIELTTCRVFAVVEGARLMLTAKVAPVGATGIVQFTDTSSEGNSISLGSVSISPNGTASVPTEPLKAGTHTLTATFAPANTTSFKTPTPTTTHLVVTGTSGKGSVLTAVPQEQSSG